MKKIILTLLSLFTILFLLGCSSPNSPLYTSNTNSTNEQTGNSSEEQSNNTPEEKLENSSGEQRDNPYKEQSNNTTGEQTDNSSEEQLNNTIGEQTDKSSEEQPDNPSEEQTDNSFEEQSNNTSGEQQDTSSDEPLDNFSEEQTNNSRTEWIYFGMEMNVYQETETFIYEYQSSTIKEFSYYNSENDCKFTLFSNSRTKKIITETNDFTISDTESKSDYTYSQNGDDITCLFKTYSKSDNEWQLINETETIFYKNTMFTLKKDDNIEKIYSENDCERYKISTTPTSYSIYEFKDNLLYKILNYSEGILTIENDYSAPNNPILQENIPSFMLNSSKTYDSQGNITQEKSWTIQDVIFDNYSNSIKIIAQQIQTIGNIQQVLTYTWIYKKVEIPFQ